VTAGRTHSVAGESAQRQVVAADAADAVDEPDPRVRAVLIDPERR
jgi:hypothetical protein